MLDFINHNFYLFFLEENIGKIQLLKTKYNFLILLLRNSYDHLYKKKFFLI